MPYNAISSLDSKVWYDVIENKPIFVDPIKSNHTKDAVENPEKYRLPAEFFKSHESHYDYDGFVLYSIMKQGFVRGSIDYRNPEKNSNLEGVSLRDLHKAAIWLDSFIGQLDKLIVVVRKSEGDKDGDAYILDDHDKIDFFLKWGKILKDRF